MKKTRRLNQVSAVSTMTMLLRHDKTESEEIFTVEFLLYLKRIGYSGVIHCRCFLVNQFGQVKRPDFYLPRYGLAIEIDGLTRDSWERRQNDISRRDRFYENLGTQPLLVLNSNWAVSGFKMDRFKKEFSELLFKNRITPKQRILINKRLSEGRKALEVSRPEIFNSHGGLASQFSSELAGAGFKEFHHFGGTRFVLREKYETKAIQMARAMSDKFKSLLKTYFGKITSTQEEEATAFATHLIRQSLDRDGRLDQIEIFAEKHGLDFPKLADAVAKLHALY